jgi:hypothetical protein
MTAFFVVGEIVPRSLQRIKYGRRRVANVVVFITARCGVKTAISLQQKVKSKFFGLAHGSFVKVPALLLRLIKFLSQASLAFATLVGGAVADLS